MNIINLFNTSVNAITMEESVDVITERIRRKSFTQHCVVNVAKIVNMRTDIKLRESVESCDIVNIDGMGVVWGARALGFDVPERVAGVDLFSKLVSMSTENKFPIFLLGATDDVVSSVAIKLKQRHPNLIIAGYHHGYFWDDEKAVVDEIKKSGAKLLFVAITSPKKENFIDKWKNDLGVDFVMGVGGTFDVVAGKVNRAPKWMQNNGLEWLYRVIQEPRRMWKRYLITNTKFCFILVKELISRNRAS